jgi:hypothetical protein
METSLKDSINRVIRVVMEFSSANKVDGTTQVSGSWEK